MSNSPPTSPLSLYKTQLVAEKAKVANSKSGKAKKASTSTSAPSRKPTAPPSTPLTGIDPVDPRPEGAGPQAEKENADPADSVNWVKCPALTSELLSIIEDSNRYRKAFGFKVIEDVSSGGLTIANVSRDIAEKLFPKSGIPLDKLGKSVTNRIRALKKRYSDFHSELGQTGHGLIVENRESEIISGTPIYNVWDKIRVKFPWYMKMYMLLHGSPVVEKVSVANSATPLNTRVLEPTMSQPPRHKSVEWNDAEIDRSFAGLDSDPTGEPEHFSDMEVDSPGKNSVPTPAQPTSAVLPQSTPPLTQPAAPSGSTPPSTRPPPSESKKRKDPYQQVQELTTTYGNSRVESERIRTETKRLRLENEIKMQRLSHEEQERQRQHEAAIIDKKIFLAKLEARNLTARAGDYSQSSDPFA